MLPPLPLVTSLTLFAIAMTLVAVGVRVSLPELWSRPTVRLALGVSCVVGLVAHVAWSVGLRHYPTSYWGASVASVEVVLACAVAASLPLAAALRWTVMRVTRTAPVTDSKAAAPRVSRRVVLEAASAAVPVLALGSGLKGFSLGASDAGSPVHAMHFPSLPKELDGLRILQLSDLHLGMGRSVQDLERLLDALGTSRQRPDLIVLTGDIAEDLALLDPALSLVRSFGARHGAFAALGNHEHLRGLRDARRRFDRSGVPLLVDEGTIVEIAPHRRLWVAGVDDPVFVHTDVRPMLRTPIERALRDAPSDAFRILLSHRPEGFDVASPSGCELTLSGHTHGGQIGFAGKSAFQALYPDGYLWGKYERSGAQLYTTSGFGAWFPFRLGCPSEAPILELRRGHIVDPNSPRA